MLFGLGVTINRSIHISIFLEKKKTTTVAPRMSINFTLKASYNCLLKKGMLCFAGRASCVITKLKILIRFLRVWRRTLHILRRREVCAEQSVQSCSQAPPFFAKLLLKRVTTQPSLSPSSWCQFQKSHWPLSTIQRSLKGSVSQASYTPGKINIVLCQYEIHLQMVGFPLLYWTTKDKGYLNSGASDRHQFWNSLKPMEQQISLWHSVCKL